MPAPTSSATTAIGPSARVTLAPAWLVRIQRDADPVLSGGERRCLVSACVARRLATAATMAAATPRGRAGQQPAIAVALAHRQLGQRRIGLGQRTVVLTWTAEQSLLASQYDGGHATAEVGHIHSAEAIDRSRIRPGRQHIGALDVLAVRAGQDHAAPASSARPETAHVR